MNHNNEYEKMDLTNSTNFTYLQYCAPELDYSSPDSYKPSCQYPYINKGFGEDPGEIVPNDCSSTYAAGE